MNLSIGRSIRDIELNTSLVSSSSYSTYRSPIVPTLFTQVSAGENASLSSTYGAQSPSFVFNHMDMVELKIVNTDAGQHPCMFLDSLLLRSAELVPDFSFSLSSFPLLLSPSSRPQVHDCSPLVRHHFQRHHTKPARSRRTTVSRSLFSCLQNRLI